MSNDKTLTLEADTVAKIRRLLLIGLASYSEVERVINAMNECCDKNIGDIPASCVPDDPSGDAGTVYEFATALRLLG